MIKCISKQKRIKIFCNVQWDNAVLHLYTGIVKLIAMALFHHFLMIDLEAKKRCAMRSNFGIRNYHHADKCTLTTVWATKFLNNHCECILPIKILDLNGCSYTFSGNQVTLSTIQNGRYIRANSTPPSPFLYNGPRAYQHGGLIKSFLFSFWTLITR